MNRTGTNIKYFVEILTFSGWHRIEATYRSLDKATKAAQRVTGEQTPVHYRILKITTEYLQP